MKLDAPKCRKCSNSAHRRHLCHKHYRAYRASRPSGIVAAWPARAHLERLRAAGMSMDRIADAAGVSRMSTVKRLLDADYPRTVRAITAAKILRVPVPEFATPEARLSEWIPAVGSRRRVQALMAIGYQLRELQPELGCSPQTLSKVVNGHQERVMTSFAGRVDEVFRRLQLHPRSDTKAIRRAHRKGWAPPLAWDEDTIDDPNAEPFLDDSRADWHDEYLDLQGMGLSDKRIAERLGIGLDALNARLRRRREVA